MKEITLNAATENLDAVLDFVNAELQAKDFPMKACMQIAIAVEEIFVNIAHYAYAGDVGKATVKCGISGVPPEAEIVFADSGIPYNPLLKTDPDTTLSAEERDIGGLGILMVKKSMDSVEYNYENGQNILTIKKKS